jgi:hypothetical protein
MTNVLLPKSAHRFRVQFDDFGNNAQSHMTSQVMRVSRPYMHRYDDFVPSGISPINIDLRDDIMDITRTEVLTQVLRQIADNVRFSMTIETVDMNAKVLEQWNLLKCRIVDCKFDDLSYYLGQDGDGLMIHLSIQSDQVSVNVGDQRVAIV